MKEKRNLLIAAGALVVIGVGFSMWKRGQNSQVTYREVTVKKGDAVRKGAGLLVLEAMKMENEIQAPADGVVEEILIEPGQTVESGAELIRIV